MGYTKSIKTRLIGIILFITTLTSLVGYGGFVYWYMGNQYDKALNLSQTVGHVLSQDIAKLVLLDEVAIAADISSKLQSFPSLTTMVLYKIDKTAIFQYNQNNTSFKSEPLPNKINRKSTVQDKLLCLYIDAKYQDTHLGFVQLKFKINDIYDVMKQNIMMLFAILIVMFIISYILAVFFAKRFTKPILDLVGFLEKVEVVDSLNNITTNEKNEYGQLYTEVNTMLERIKLNQEALKIAAVSFNTQSGTIVTSNDNRILQVNKAFTTITGYSEDEVVGQNPTKLQSGLHDASFYMAMYKSLEETQYWSGEINNRHKNGNIIKEMLTIQVILDDNQEILYYVASFLDITLQKETEAQLKEKDSILVQQSKMAAMGEMLENIAHQWRQPLSLISTVTSGMLLSKECGIPTEDKDEIKQLEQIGSTVNYLSQTINDFRDFFKPSKTKKEFEVTSIYKNTLNLVDSKFQVLNIEVIEKLQEVHLVNLDNELMQVMMNILNNARDILETKEDRRIIFVNIYQNNHNATIQIKDNAGGIPNTIIDRIFEPYFTTKHKTQGTGIGLYMSQEMITKHIGGTLSVHNDTFTFEDTQYTGACFTITIPLK